MVGFAETELNFLDFWSVETNCLDSSDANLLEVAFGSCFGFSASWAH